MRKSGILMHLASLPSEYGVGTMGAAARKFADFLSDAGQQYWQLLPICPTSYGDSPYQSFSTFAGNPYFIDLDLLASEGLLDKKEYVSVNWGDDVSRIDYGRLYEQRYPVLKLAAKRFLENESEDFETFCELQAFWLEDYALFMTLKDTHGGCSWWQWEDELKRRDHSAIDKVRETMAEQIAFWKVLQYFFFRQWKSLKQYVNDKGIDFIGDLPIYVSQDSVDVWAHPELFQLDENLTPIKVAGVPPDAFSDAGQKWGNPLYDYDKMEANGFSWWRKRMAASAKLYDVIRIDHFIGIVKYYTIPADMPDARQGEYRQGPGQKLLDVINESIGDKKIIAEDLGVEVPEVAKILKENGYPGMKVLEFAFGGDRKNPHLPYNYTQNLVCYGGTHDNETLLGFFEDRGDWELGYAYDYLDTRDKGRMVDQVFRAAYSSVAVLTVFAVQDILKLGNWARMNLPSSMGNNWKWRMQKGQLGQHELECMRYLASVFDRERK